MKNMRRFVILLVMAMGMLSMPIRAEPPPHLDPLSEGLWWLYQLQYEKAYALFSHYAQTHPDDPAGYFYKTATDWWQLAQEFDYDLPDIRTRLEKDYEDTGRVGSALLNATHDRHQKALASLYWGGAEGLKGRWLAAQKQWVAAYFLGKRGNNLLHDALKYDPTLYDAYMGIGIYDYFTDTLGGVIGVLSKLLVHGNRKRGIEELQVAIERSPHARVESMVFLVEIYTFEEHTPKKALPLADALHREFPQSPAMHLAQIMALYQVHDWKLMRLESQRFLELSETEEPYYTHKGIRPALYCLGIDALWSRHDPDACMDYMTRILSGGIDSSRWVTFAYLRRGQVYDLRGEREKAVADYHTVLFRKDFWGSHNEASQYLDHPFHY